MMAIMSAAMAARPEVEFQPPSVCSSPQENRTVVPQTAPAPLSQPHDEDGEKVSHLYLKIPKLSFIIYNFCIDILLHSPKKSRNALTFLLGALQQTT